MAAGVDLDLTKYQRVLVDNTGAPNLVYYGITENEKAQTSDGEWAILREQTVGSVTTYSWARFRDGKPAQLYAWDDRATLDY